MRHSDPAGSSAMSTSPAIIQSLERSNIRSDLPEFRVGDTVAVHYKIVEGDKLRVQVFRGTVIKRHRAGARSTITVRKVSFHVGVERIFLLNSPRHEKIGVVSRGIVRRARLFYLRELSGKKARLRSKVRDIAALMARPDEVGTAEEAIAAEAEAQATEEPAQTSDEAPKPEKPE